MMKLHGFVMSPNTRRARWMLEECGAEYTFVDVDLMTAEHKGDAYRALNPTARVPTLVDGDFTLWESNAILEYLAAKLPAARLGGADAREIGEVARWTFMNAAHLSPNVARIFAHTIRLPPEKRIPQLVDEGRSEVDRSLAAFDAALAGREHVVGRFTIADISIAATLSAAPMLGIDLSRFANVAAWYARVAARPAFKKVFG
jgi:glutathione S-transferase